MRSLTKCSIFAGMVLAIVAVFSNIRQIASFSTSSSCMSRPHADDRATQPVSIIFDTDMYSDIDDMLALAMLHTLQDRGEVKLLAITVGTEAPWTAPYVDLIDTFYGHGDIPVGIVRGGITAGTFDQMPFTGPKPFSPNGINYTQHMSMLANRDGSFVYPHKLVDSKKAEEAVHLLRRILKSQPERSVVMIEVGYTTNFARLLESEPESAGDLDGRALLKRKVRLLSLMGGSFAAVGGTPAGDPRLEFNLSMDIPSAKKIFSRWPTPIVVSGAEIGIKMLFPQSSINRCFYYGRHPVAETYNYVAPYYPRPSNDPNAPHDHPTCDLTSVLYAARPEDGYFNLSPPGTIIVGSDGGTRFEPAEGGTHRYLVLSDSQKDRTLEAMIMLVTQPPVSRGQQPPRGLAQRQPH